MLWLPHDNAVLQKAVTPKPGRTVAVCAAACLTGDSLSGKRFPGTLAVTYFSGMLVGANMRGWQRGSALTCTRWACALLTVGTAQLH